MGVVRRLAGLAGVGAAAYVGLVTGAMPVDLGVGRRVCALGPLSVDIAAPRELVFELLAQPYLDPRPPKALRDKVQVLERGTDMVLAQHRTPLRGGLVARTVETVRFTRPERIDFRLVRGPVPHVVEQFRLSVNSVGTRLDYDGELGTDLWSAGQWWGQRVALQWEAVVAASFDAVKAEAERRTGRGR